MRLVFALFFFLTLCVCACAWHKTILWGFDCDDNNATALMVQSVADDILIDSVFLFSKQGDELISYRTTRSAKDGAYYPVYIATEGLAVGDTVVIRVYTSIGVVEESNVVFPEMQNYDE